MPDQVIEGTEPEAKGLDAYLNAAIEEHYIEPGAEPKIQPEGDEEVAKSEGRPRNKAGRFVSGAKPSSDGTAEAPSAEAQPDPAATPIEAPRNYTSEQKAEFAKLPDEAKKFLAQSEKEREAEYTRRSQEIAEYKRTADPYVQAITPYNEYLTQLAPQLGRTPTDLLSTILQTEYTLRTGAPAQKYQAFAQLAQIYGLDPRVLIGGNIPVQQQPHPAYNPELMQTRQELAQIKQWQQNVQAQQELAFAQQHIAEVSQQKDENGQAKFPHFERVKPLMASFLQNGQAETIEQAYELALTPFKDIITKEVAAIEQKQAVEKAKKAAPVRSSTGAMPQGKGELKGLDAHLSAALEKYYRD